MQASKELMKKAGVLPKLRLGDQLPKGGVKSTGPHRVKMLGDKLVMDIDPKTGKEAQYIRYLLEKDGEKMTYQTKVYDKEGNISYLVERLSQIPEGAEVILELRNSMKVTFIHVIEVPAAEQDQV